MINTKKELKFYIKADLMMNRGTFDVGFKKRIVNFFSPDYVIHFLKVLRKSEYYYNKNKFLSKYYKWKKHKLELKLGFSIGSGVFGYGLTIPHYGTIVVGSGNKIGNYCVLHTGICITAGEKQIGNGLYLASGSKLVKDIKLGNNITVGVNSVVNNSFVQNNLLLVGMPAIKKSNSIEWYLRDGTEYSRRVNMCESLKKQLSIK
ncbi:hypothetical protein LI055_04585 [Clostridium perfringens]|uniref:hypothetical protein n=1 Tax=Clostridium perfringens TaxID=1502 RepID=UPI0022468427|nr:hypothetical protein [Clostridium perfringens]MCX0378906.1 hypothetical protein [Clostridium perfringens]